MKKISKLSLQGAKLLTAKQMRSTMGGYDSYSNDGLGCRGKQQGAFCLYHRNGRTRSGNCRYMPFAGLICWGG
jgi:hypothetical protein